MRYLSRAILVWDLIYHAINEWAFLFKKRLVLVWNRRKLPAVQLIIIIKTYTLKKSRGALI
jgi:hypothetical protein